MIGAYVLTTAVLTALGAVLRIRVPGNLTGSILIVLGLWQALTLFASSVLIQSRRSGFGRRAIAKSESVARNLDLRTTDHRPRHLRVGVVSHRSPASPGGVPFVWLATIGTVAWAAVEASRPELGLTGLLNPYANPRLVTVGDIVSLSLVGSLAGKHSCGSGKPEVRSVSSSSGSPSRASC